VLNDNSNHVVLDFSAVPVMARCKHCGWSAQVPRFIDVRLLKALSDGWLWSHRNCTAPATEVRS
jgi:hypothetical protein